MALEIAEFAGLVKQVEDRLHDVLERWGDAGVSVTGPAIKRSRCAAASTRDSGWVIDVNVIGAAFALDNLNIYLKIGFPLGCDDGNISVCSRTGVHDQSIAGYRAVCSQRRAVDE